MNKYVILTSYERKPMPLRSHDWCAVEDQTYDGQETDPIGYGETEFDAIRALIDQLEMKADS